MSRLYIHNFVLTFFLSLNILEEIRDLTENEIGRNWDIGQILRNLSRHWGYLADMGN